MPPLVDRWFHSVTRFAGGADEGLRAMLERFVADEPALAARVKLDAVDRLLEGRGPSGAEPGPRVWEDLVLCVAAIAGDAQSLERLHARLTTAAKLALGRYCESAEALAESVQRTSARVLVDQGQGPKLLEYSGRGPLEAWIRVVAVRTHLNSLPSTQVLASEELEKVADDLLESSDPELDALKKQAREAFQQALLGSAQRLELEERVLLRKRFVHGLDLNTIAEQDQVDRATVVRRLARAREKLKAGLVGALAGLLRLEAEEIPSLLRVLGSNPGLNLTEALRSLGK